MQLIDAPVLGMSDNEFNYALKVLQDKKIISGLKLTKGYDGKIIRAYTSNVQLTENAEKYYKNLYPIEENKIQKKKKIFISHASNDLSYVKLLVEFMESINVPEKGIFSSSLPGYGIPLGENIYEYIRKQALEYEIKMYLILSDNFCNNSSCRTELGLLLTLELKNISFYLPGFDIRNTPRELNPQIMGIKYVYM